MGLFGIIPKESTEEKRLEQIYFEKYNKKLERYSKSLEHFDGVVKRLEVMIEDYELKDHDRQASKESMGMDLNYLKGQMETSYQLLEEINQGIDRENERRIDIERKLRINNRLQKTSIFTQVLILAVMIAILLNMLGVIVF